MQRYCCVTGCDFEIAVVERWLLLVNACRGLRIVGLCAYLDARKDVCLEDEFKFTSRFPRAILMFVVFGGLGDASISRRRFAGMYFHLGFTEQEFLPLMVVLILPIFLGWNLSQFQSEQNQACQYHNKLSQPCNSFESIF